MVATAVAAQEETAGVDVGVVGDTGGSMAGRTRIAPTFVESPTANRSVEEDVAEARLISRTQVPDPLPAMAPE